MNLSVFQIVVLAVFGALAVAGVAIFAFVVGGAQTQRIGDVEVWGTFDDAAIAAVLRQLSDSDATFKNIVYVEKKPETYSRELTEALATGKGPDAFFMQHDDAFREKAKIIPIPYESLSREQFESTFVQAAESFLGTEGVVAIPILIDPLVLYWNKDMLETAGFSKPPSTWDELYKYATALTKKDDTNTIERSAIAFGEYQNVTHAKDILSLLILQAGGTITKFQDGTLIPSLGSRSRDVQQPTESALRFYTEFANPSNIYYSWNRAQRESRAAFTGNVLALYLGKASEEPLIRQTNPNLNFAVAPIPQIKGQDAAVNFGTVYALAVPRTSDNPGGARTMLPLLASAEASRLLSEATGIPSARRDVLAGTMTGLDELFGRQAIIARTWLDPDPEKTDELFRAMIEGITSGASKLNEAIQRGEDTMSSILQNQ